MQRQTQQRSDVSTDASVSDTAPSRWIFDEIGLSIKVISPEGGMRGDGGS